MAHLSGDAIPFGRQKLQEELHLREVELSLGAVPYALRNGIFVKHSFVVSLAAIAAITPSFAMDPRFAASLRKLDPQTRLEQVCDLEAMSRIAKDARPFRPDRAKTDVISHPQHAGDVVKGSGGAFRSKGRWYSFSFVCKGSPDHMSVLSFSYKIGEPIPESKWAAYGLWR